MSRPGEELAELLWDNGPALRTTTPHLPPPFQPFTCSAAGSSRAHAHAKAGAGAAVAMEDGVGLGGIPVHDDDAVPWLHCPVAIDSDTAPLPPEYCAGLLSGYPGGPSLHAVPAASGIEPPSSNGAVAVPPEAEAALPQPNGGEGVMNFTFFSRPLQRPETSLTNRVESTAVQTAASRLRSTPLFSEQRMAAWLQPTKGPRAATAATPQAPSLPDQAAAKVNQHRLQPDADATAAVTTSSVCSGHGDRSQAKMMSSHQPTVADCSMSQDEDVDDEPGAMRRSAALSLRGTKRTRTAEVHNLSERRRRDRINEKMRALQELIPNCNKVDKASMLEEAIEYLKTLQLQLQMVMTMSSMGAAAAAAGMCVPPTMLMQVPSMAPFPHHLGMGLGFGVGAAAAGFDVLPRLAGAHQFPFPLMPPGTMFGVSGGQAMPSPAPPFAHMAGEQREASGEAGAGDHPPVAVAPQVDQNQQHPKQT